MESNDYDANNIRDAIRAKAKSFSEKYVVALMENNFDAWKLIRSATPEVRLYFEKGILPSPEAQAAYQTIMGSPLPVMPKVVSERFYDLPARRA